MAEHPHRNVPLCSLLDSDGNAETSVDTGADPTETAAYAGESSAISTSLFEPRPFSACNTFSVIHLIMLDVNYMVWCCQGLPGIDLAAQLSQ